MTNLTIKERLDLLPPDQREASFFIPQPKEITEKILDIYYIPKTKEYLNYLMYTTEGVLSNKDVIKGYLKDCIKIYEGTYEPFRESLTFNYGFRPLSEEEFIYKGEEFIQDSRWYTQDTPAIEDTIKAIDKKIEELEDKRLKTILNIK
jgi:hypothetical protein